jgi:hypothetical protein
MPLAVIVVCRYSFQLTLYPTVLQLVLLHHLHLVFILHFCGIVGAFNRQLRPSQAHSTRNKAVLPLLRPLHRTTISSTFVMPTEHTARTRGDPRCWLVTKGVKRTGHARADPLSLLCSLICKRLSSRLCMPIFVLAVAILLAALTAATTATAIQIY